MNVVKIYGASDDLIEIDGEVKGCDEYSPDDDIGYVELSTGDVFKVEYTKGGTWRVSHLLDSKKLQVEIEKCPEDDDPDPYTDTATVRGEIAWVDLWNTWPPSMEEVQAKGWHSLENGIPAKHAKAIYELLNGPRSWEPMDA